MDVYKLKNLAYDLGHRDERIAKLANDDPRQANELRQRNVVAIQAQEMCAQLLSVVNSHDNLLRIARVVADWAKQGADKVFLSSLMPESDETLAEAARAAIARATT